MFLADVLADDDDRDDVADDVDVAADRFYGIAGHVVGVFRQRYLRESATPSIATSTAATRIVVDASDENDGRFDDGRGILVVVLVRLRRAQQTSSFRKRSLVAAGLAEAVINEPFLIQQDARNIEVANER